MSTNQKLKQAIYGTSRQITREVGANFGLDFESDAIDVIAELAWKTLSLYAEDLEAFQKHAKRSTINADDVKLLARRNESLRELMDSKLQAIQSNKPVTEAANGALKRKRKP